MSVRPLAFRPPSLELDAELDWILKRAFGPRESRIVRSVSGERALDIALRLGVATRIAARHPHQALVQELGADTAQRLREEYLQNAARGALLERSLGLLIDRASALEIPCILLKYAALSRMGVLAKGARWACDLDVLVPRSRAAELQRALLRAGYEDVGLPESAHQLPGLHDPDGVLVEIHVHVPAISLAPGQPFVDADTLTAAGLTRLSGGALLPTPAFITAHALAHGLVQHARAPHMYSPLRAFADLLDLAGAGHGEWDQASPFLSAAMTPDDLQSALALARSLDKGDLEGAKAGGAGVLLRHALASQLNPLYAARLRLRMLTQPGPSPLHLTPARIIGVLRQAWGWAGRQRYGLRLRP